MSQDERHRADGVFEGGGVKGIAFAGAIAAAEKDGGVREWVNIAGTSAGAIVAALLAVGYDAAGLQRILNDAKYPRSPTAGSAASGAAVSSTRSRACAGSLPATTSTEWMSEQLAASPLAKKLGKTELTFADVKRLDLPPRDRGPGHHRRAVRTREVPPARDRLRGDERPDAAASRMRCRTTRTSTATSSTRTPSRSSTRSG